MTADTILGKKIKNIRTAKGLTQKELAKKMNISQNTVSQHENGIRGLSEKDINAYAQALNVSLYELFDDSLYNSKYQDIMLKHGVNKEYNTSIPDFDSIMNTDKIKLELNLIETFGNDAGKLINNFDKLTDIGKRKLVNYSDDLIANSSLVKESQSSIVEEARLTPVATTESAAAGTGYTYGDNEITYYYTDRTDLPSYDFATVIKGDSMEPVLHNGDIALIKQGYDNVNGDIYVVDYDGKSYIKKLYNDGDRFRLISINRNYKNIIIDVPPEDEIYFNIIGKVIGSFTPIDPNNN